VTAGAIALPTLLKLVTVMQAKPNSDWTTRDSIPVSHQRKAVVSLVLVCFLTFYLAD